MTRFNRRSPGLAAAGGVLGVFLLLALLGAPRGGAQVAAPAEPPAVLDVPFIPQSELLCGGAAASMVLRYWGATGVFPEDFEHLVRPEEGGIRTGDLAAEVRRLGWRAVSFRWSGDQLRDQIQRGRPVIALVEVAPERYHYVVVVAWTDHEVLFHDPARAPFRSLSPSEFLGMWRPTDRWALLILPEEPGVETGPEGGGEADSGPVSPIDVVPDSLPPTRARSSSLDAAGACGPVLREAVTRVRAGDDVRAEQLLRDATARCPESGRVRAELAGLYASRGMWRRARETAEIAVELSPSLEYGWRILATARYLTGDRLGALAAWNQIGEPRIERIRLEGLEGTRYAEVQARTGLDVDDLLTPGRLTRASRRLDLLPSAELTGVRYAPRADGRVEVTGTVVQHPVFPGSFTAWGGILVRGLVSRRVTIHSGSPFGAAELWTAGGRWEENRPAFSFGVSVPDAPLLPGVVTLEGGWERQTYRTDASRTVREERRMARIGTTDWLTGRIRGELVLGLDRWVGEVGGPAGVGGGLDGSSPSLPAGTLDGTLRAGLELRTRRDRLSVRAHGGLGTVVSGAVGRTYYTGGVRFRWRSSDSREGPVAHLWAGGRIVSDDAPLAYWPGAGDGRSRDGLLRAHPLLHDGIIAGATFGRSLVNAGIEGRWWTASVLGVTLGPAVFLDVARAWRTLGEEGGSPVLVDAGVGIRANVPGRSGGLRADVARGLRGGDWVVEAGWEAPWPFSF